jgi:general secretion pathway protein J
MTEREAAGFTLLEVVVALAIFGFLLVGLNQTVRFGLNAWQQDIRMSDRKTDLEAVDRSLRSILENLAPGDDAARPSFDGSADRLIGETRIRVPGSGLVPIRIEAGLAVSGNRLILRWRPHRHVQLVGSETPPQETELVNGVNRLEIAYWQPAGIWVTSWHQPDLPLLIRMRITFTGQGPPRWPDILVAPLLSRP